MKRICLLIPCLLACGSSDATQRELCHDIAASLCTRADACDPLIDQAACAERAATACCAESNCEGPPLLDGTQSALCLAAIDRMTCSALDDGPPRECEPPRQAMLTTKWKLVARGYEFGCAAFTTPEVAITVQGAMSLPPATAACSAGVLVSSVPEGSYTVQGVMRSRGSEIKTANAQGSVRGPSTASLVFRFDEFALGSEFSDTFASAFCGKCGSSNPLGCQDTVRRWACEDEGTCDLPTWGQTADLGKCRADVAAQPCDAQYIPSSCAYFKKLLPGLVR